MNDQKTITAFKMKIFVLQKKLHSDSALTKGSDSVD